MSMHPLYKPKQVFFLERGGGEDFLFIIQLPGSRSKLMTLQVILTL